MTFRTAVTAAQAVRPARGILATGAARVSPFSTTSQLSLKESSDKSGVDHEKHKEDSLSKQKKGQGHWKPELASDSEEAVKADRYAPNDTSKLQEYTKRTAEETSKAGTSTRDGL